MTGAEFEVNAFETPSGEWVATGQLPYNEAELAVLLKLLNLGRYPVDQFSVAQNEVLERLGLVRQEQLVFGWRERIGQALHNAVFTGDVEVAFRSAMTDARAKPRKRISLQLRFNPDATDLARYPWELVHDGHRHLLATNSAEISRYITYGEAVAAPYGSPPWRMLFVTSRPRDLDPLCPDDEFLAVWNALQDCRDTRNFAFERLDNPTYDMLTEQLGSRNYDLIHFDGHGVFGRQCPQCHTMHYPHMTACQTCSTRLDDVPAQGYLALTDDNGNADLVGTGDLESALSSSNVRLALVSACQSSLIRGDSLFVGLGPGLVRAGIPAVVAMQFSMPAKAAVEFSKGFYRALARGATVLDAVSQGRRSLVRDNMWFVPTLYLRSQDYEGHLFIT